MKKLLLASILLAANIWPAMAADQKMPYLKAPPPAPVFSWSGCYLGAQGGWATGRTHTWDPVSGSDFQPKFDISGGVAGGEAGCQAQFNQFVVGIETDLSWSDKKGTAFDGQPGGNPAIQIQIAEAWLATVRGRLGLAVGHALFYVTGGLATAKVNWQGSLLPPAFPFAFVSTDGAFMVGSVVGAGIEYSFWNNWSAKAEFLFADLGTERICSSPCQSPFGAFQPRKISLTDNIVRVGINYHVGP